MARPYRSDFPPGEAGDIAFWAAYRRWQATQAIRAMNRG